MDILKSRTFWLLLLDLAGSLLLHYFVGEEVKYLIITLQPVLLFAIGKFTIDDREKQLNYRAELDLAATREYNALRYKGQ